MKTIAVSGAVTTFSIGYFLGLFNSNFATPINNTKVERPINPSDSSKLNNAKIKPISP